ncbi:Acetolactate synthase large subunit IlvB1 [Paraburkholderia humisilvae]|uniref:Acetolactate synthase large subunit IlvB1 n=2 Tax=Paraburkholderia humisilvae TaxID=627669 RepID=A0A6J5FBV1_9BURK|nr:Acetolactate synthase large subunit IlvB1 [Paraburkholderia humisilvae]
MHSSGDEEQRPANKVPEWAGSDRNFVENPYDLKGAIVELTNLPSRDEVSNQKLVVSKNASKGKCNVADFLMRALAVKGVDTIFLVPGKMVYPLLKAIDESRSIRAIVAAHEAGSAFMADGYARSSGKFGACLAISGPGAMNFMPGMAAARADKIPVLYISGGISSSDEGKGAFQDATLGGIAESNSIGNLIKNVVVLRNKKSLRAEMRRLMNGLNWTRRNQSYISIPVDVQAQEIPFVPTQKTLLRERVEFSGGEFPANATAVMALCDSYLTKNKKIAFLVGSRVNDRVAASYLIKVAERFSIPVATTISGKGSFPESHSLSLGVYGFAGHARAIDLINSAELDALVVFGSDLNQRDSLNWSSDLTDKKDLIIFDDSFDAPAQGHIESGVVLSGIRETFKMLAEMDIMNKDELSLAVKTRKEWLINLNKGSLYDPQLENADFRVSNDGPSMYPGEAIKRLGELLPKETNIVVDSGAHRVYMAHYWISSGVANYFSSSTLGPMGWAIAAGIGVKLGAPNCPCVVVTGDGCMLMHGVEIQTAARYGVKVIYIVLNNAAHGPLQIDVLRNGAVSERFGTLPRHDWAGFARSLGVAARVVERVEDLEGAVDDAMRSEGPFLIEVMVGVHPAPNRYYEESVAKSRKAEAALGQ